MIRLLIVDDDSIFREALVRHLAREREIVIAGHATSGAQAVDLAMSLKPDVVTMDVMMPGLDGVTAIEQIMGTSPTRILLVSAIASGSRTEMGFKALQAGALDVFPKPLEKRPEVWAAELAARIRMWAEVPVVGRWRRTRPPSGPNGVAALVERAGIDVVGIAASAGGPAALAEILAALPADFPVPIVVAQHMPAGLTDGLIRWLDRVSPLSVRAGKDGSVVRAGEVYLAPDGRDIELSAKGTLRTPPCEGRHRPSCDRLLVSLARAYRHRSCGVVLTGMGDDGTRGLAAIHAAGGVTLAQDGRSATVDGMPRAAREAGVAQSVVALDSIPQALLVLARRIREQSPESST